MQKVLKCGEILLWLHCIFTTFYEKKMATKAIFDIFWLRHTRKTHFCTLTMATAVCLCQSAARSKHQNSAKTVKVAALFWLHPPPQWVRHSQCLGCGQVRLSNGEKGHRFESNSTKTTRDTCKKIGQCLQG